MPTDIRTVVANEARRAVEAAWGDMMRDAGCGGDYFLWHDGKGGLLIAKDWPEAPKGFVLATTHRVSGAWTKERTIAWAADAAMRVSS